MKAGAGWKITDLGTLGRGSSFAEAINEQGWVVGYSEAPDGRLRAFLWRNGIMEDLGLGVAGFESVAWDINDRGQVAGTLEFPEISGGWPGTSVGFIWEGGYLRFVALGDSTNVYLRYQQQTRCRRRGLWSRVCFSFLLECFSRE